MTLSFGLALAVFLVGLIVLCVQRRFNDVWYIMCLAGLIAVLLTLGGHATLSIGR